MFYLFKDIFVRYSARQAGPMQIVIPYDALIKKHKRTGRDLGLGENVPFIICIEQELSKKRIVCESVSV